jgi:hypothetical protein
VRYYVAWKNPSASYNNRLDSFNCAEAAGSSTNRVCDFNIHDVKMLAPPSGATVTHPYTFIWERRSTAADNYTVQLFNASQALLFELADLGYIDRVTVADGTGTAINTQYYWSMKVETPQGIGYAYFVRPIRWSDLNGPALGGPATGALLPWQVGEPALEDLIRPAE